MVNLVRTFDLKQNHLEEDDHWSGILEANFFGTNHLSHHLVIHTRKAGFRM